MEQAPELVPLMPRPSDRRKMHPNWQLWSKPAGDSANPRSNVTAGPEFCCFSYTSFQFVGCFFFRLLDFGTPNHRGAFFPQLVAHSVLPNFNRQPTQKGGLSRRVFFQGQYVGF